MKDHLSAPNRPGQQTSYNYDANFNRLSGIDKTTSDSDLDGFYEQEDFTATSAQALSIDAGRAWLPCAKRCWHLPAIERCSGSCHGYRHCLASCEMARENTAAVAQCFGWANEKRGDWLRNQERGERQMDDFNNSRGFQFGRNAQSYQSCRSSCMGAATLDGLKTYAPGTTPGYWN